MKFYRAEEISRLRLQVDQPVKLESLRQAVVPPFLMLLPCIEVPDEIVVEEQLALDEDGVHGCVYVLRAEAPCRGTIVVGFRDLQTGATTHHKAIRVSVYPE